MMNLGLMDPAFLGGLGGERDPYFANVSLLLHGNGANGSTSIIDSSPTPKTITAVGNAQISTAQSKFGGASIAFDGSGDYTSTVDSSAFQIGLSNEPFTLEFWFYLNATGDHAFFSRGGGAGNWNTDTGYQYFAFIQSGALYWMWNDNLDGTPTFISTTTLPPIQQWNHYAAAYDATTTRLYINELSIGTPSTLAYQTPSLANRIRVGASPVDSSLLGLNGYIDELRITKGVCRYEVGTGANAGKMVHAGTNILALPTAPFPDA